MQNPDNLRVAKEAEKLANAIYDYTRRFPREEIFGLTAQMRSAAISVGSNIFEACGRQGNRKGESNASARNFYYHSNGSATELVFQLRIARHQKMGDAEEAATIEKQLELVRRQLRRLIINLPDRS
jgi:four helix bundle protein